MRRRVDRRMLPSISAPRRRRHSARNAMVFSFAQLAVSFSSAISIAGQLHRDIDDVRRKLAALVLWMTGCSGKTPGYGRAVSQSGGPIFRVRRSLHYPLSSWLLSAHRRRLPLASRGRIESLGKQGQRRSKPAVASRRIKYDNNPLACRAARPMLGWKRSQQAPWPCRCAGWRRRICPLVPSRPSLEAPRR
jgi:hypothetical protein